ncbi:MAG: ribosome assembly factor SBDS [Nanoarchaeota archaeon]|nr:ribosome assembly factor SBDS [Nanoarchaeota archaeon]MBU1027418.1 ribosome assembly factor SBDS [Nanoarchaeota archaeon]
MTQTLARIKKVGKNFEIIVDLDDALKFKKNEISSIEAKGEKIFTDSKKGQVASNSDLQGAFGTQNISEIVSKIIKEGEVQTTQEHRDAQQEKKFNQVVDFLTKNAIDPQSGNPHTPERIKSSLTQAGVNIKNIPIESQIQEIVESLSKIIPIKISTKKVKVTIPAMHTGQAYGIINPHKKEEKWKDNGDIEAILEVPSGIIMDFYDKLNSITHGSALTEEIKDDQ